MITIHYDFSTGEEISLVEGREKKDNFKTHCINFFDFDNLDVDVKVLKKDGSYILLSELLLNNGDYCEKEIRIAHNISKILLSGRFKFKKD